MARSLPSSFLAIRCLAWFELKYRNHLPIWYSRLHRCTCSVWWIKDRIKKYDVRLCIGKWFECSTAVIWYQWVCKSSESEKSHQRVINRKDLFYYAPCSTLLINAWQPVYGPVGQLQIKGPYFSDGCCFSLPTMLVGSLLRGLHYYNKWAKQKMANGSCHIK